MTRPVTADEGVTKGGCGCFVVLLFAVAYVLLGSFFFPDKQRSTAPPAPPACVDGQVVRPVSVRQGDLVWCDEAGRIRVKSPPRVQGGLYVVVHMDVVCPCSGDDARLEVSDEAE